MLIVLTRPTHRAMAATAELRSAGHTVRCVPLTEVFDHEPFPDPSAFDGVLFTSVNAADRAPARASWPRVGAVGPATRAALEARGIAVAVTGTGGGAELAQAWGDCAGSRLLLPQAAGAHPALAEGLRARGAALTCVRLYRSEALAPERVDRLALEGADVICFFAPSQVVAYRALDVVTNAKFCAHGPTTLAAMRGLAPVIGFRELTGGA